MDEITLQTRQGGFIAVVEIIATLVQPRGILWYDRFFVLWDSERNIYREDLLVRSFTKKPGMPEALDM